MELIIKNNISEYMIIDQCINIEIYAHQLVYVSYYTILRIMNLI